MIFSIFIFSSIFVLIENACLDGSLEWQSNCLIFNTNASGFAKAEIACTKMGGHLASIHDAFTNAVLGQEAPGGSAETDFWIGANTLMFHGNWSWTDGTSFDFQDWNQGGSSNTTGSYCAALSLTDGYWSAQDCFKNKSFVCAIPEQVAPTYPALVNCSDGWIYFAPTHSCYGGKYGGFSGKWNEAENYCENFGAHLPTIHSFEEFRFIETYMYEFQAAFWTGMFTVDSGRTWKTTDNSPSDFLNGGKWRSGHPTNITGQSCVYITCCPDCYDNINCAATSLRGICKKPL